jgi:peptidoglycan/LPS O-acetylase OafA/YrhL
MSSTPTQLASPAPDVDPPAPARGGSASTNHGSVQRIAAVDGLRGLAIVLVMLTHFVRTPASGLLVDRTFARIASIGWCGVDLFFVLSGFLITGILLDGTASGSSPRNFYVRRALRVVPVYYAILSLILVVYPRMRPSDSTAIAHLAHTQGWYWGFASNVLLTRPGQWDAALPWTLHFWSLAVEEQFYLVWPVLIWLSGRRHAAALCVAAMLVSVVSRMVWVHTTGDTLGSYVLTPLRFDGLAAGAFVAVAMRSPRMSLHLERWAAATALVAATGFAYLVVSTPDALSFQPRMQLVGFPVLAVGFAALLVLCLRRDGAVARWMSVRPLRFAGRYSYAAYLLHYPVIFAVVACGLRDDALPRLAGSQLHSMLLLVVVAASVSFLLAWATWFLIERHAMRLKHRFPYGVAGAPTRTAVRLGEATAVA